MKKLVKAVLWLAATLAVGQTPEQANDYFQKADWPNAAKAYQAIVTQQPGNAMAWFRLGASQHAMSKYPEALESYGKAESAGFRPVAQIYYRQARTYSQMKDADKAFDALHRSIQNGFSLTATLQNDAEFANVRNDPRFAKAITETDHTGHPCRYDPEYRQFDFWLGEWDVLNPQGQKFARSSIQSIIEDCVIFENYDQGNGMYVGKSFSAYDATTHHWTQRWIDGTGRVTDYVADFVDGEMRFRTETVSPAGVKTLVKMTFQKQGPDKVRQFLENSTDGGKTWNVTYDGVYVRRK